MYAMTEYSYLVVYIPRGTTRDAARRILTDHAEYGRWELARLRLHPDGSRKATLRRPIIRAVRNDDQQPAPSRALPAPGRAPGTGKAVHERFWFSRSRLPRHRGAGPPGDGEQPVQQATLGRERHRARAAGDGPAGQGQQAREVGTGDGQ
jgi:hypothetical protein